MKREAKVAPVLSVGMGQHSSRAVRLDTHHGNEQPGGSLTKYREAL